MDIDGCIQATVPLSELSKSMSKTDLLTAMQVRGLFFYTLNTMKELRAALIEHEAKSLSCCTQSKSSFKILKSGKKSQEKTSTNQSIFPPKPPSESLKRQIIRDFCEEVTPENMIEAGCAVCGCLSRKNDMEDLTEDLFDHDILEDPTSRKTRRERHSSSEHIQCLPGPVFEKSCSKVCLTCLKDLKRGKVPKFALVNGNWIGDVPVELQGLTMLEQMLISRLRHSGPNVRPRGPCLA